MAQLADTTFTITQPPRNESFKDGFLKTIKLTRCNKTQGYLCRKRWSLIRLIIIVSFIAILALATLIILLLVKLPYRSNSTSNNTTDVCFETHETYGDRTPSILGIYNKFAVAVDNGYCSGVGKEILLKNGSAVDAIIAAQLCNGIATAQSAGIGGGHFMVIYLKDQKRMYAIDAREEAPMNAYVNMFDNRSSLIGGLASGVPGEINGFWQAHQLAGKLPWKDLFQPAINMCENGFKMSKEMASVLVKNEQAIRNSSELSNIFINNATNMLLKENDTFRMPNLGKTLRIISEEGVSAFYNGSLTSKIVREVNENGGNFTIEDLNNYRALVKNPVIEQLDDTYTVITHPLPSSGLLVPFIMRVMKGYNLTNEIVTNKNQSVLYYHRLIETLKHAFALRSYFGDDAFENTTELVEQIKNESYINEIRSKISDYKTFPPAYYESSSITEDHGTTHLSILANGDAVSLTSTVNIYFGAKYVGKDTGIIYNNQMDDFSSPNLINYFGLKPSEANYIKPGKRPMSSMSPTIIIDKNDNVRLVLGASGGTKIITSVAQVALKNLYTNLNIKEVVDLARVHDQIYPEYTEAEPNLDPYVKDGLTALGHTMKCIQIGSSVIQAISNSNGIIQANCDYRKGGFPEGL